jgi:membrane-associated protease RseP (regulator of RpoE activity)
MSSTCAEGWSTMGALGITDFSCDCTFDRGADPAWRFRAEPRIRGIAADGPASGSLRVGDVLVAIDGMLITTRAAGARLANVRPGVPLRLTVRRGNRELDVRIVPSDEPCEAPPTPETPTPTAATPSPPRPASLAPVARAAPPARVSATTPPSLPALPASPVPTAWFGFGISCRNCEMNVTNHAEIEQAEEALRRLMRESGDDDSAPVRAARARVRTLRRENTSWRFSEYPSLFSVDPGSPAYDAGLRRGDVLMKIDGFSLLSVEGASRFGQVEPGQLVDFTFRRGGSERSVRVRAVDRPTGRVARSSAGLTEAMADLERIQTQRDRQLEEHAALLHESLERAADEAGSESRQQQLSQLRAELDRINTTRSAESQEQLNKLRSELARLEVARGDVLA